MSSHNPLVFSTDPDSNRRCARCKNIESACTCPKETSVNGRVSAVLRLEKAHRGGKVVTVIDRLPRSEPFLKDLAAELKKKCGCGGTYRLETQSGVIEIQGDRRETLRDELQRRGIKYKG